MAASAWITHVKKYAKANNIEFGEALKKAGPSYKPVATAAPTRKAKKSRGKRSKRGKTSKKR